MNGCNTQVVPYRRVGIQVLALIHEHDIRSFSGSWPFSSNLVFSDKAPTDA